MTIRVDVVCFDLPAPRTAAVAKTAGGQVLGGQAGPVVIRLGVRARKPAVAARKATEQVRAALDDTLGPSEPPHAVLPIIPDTEGD